MGNERVSQMLLRAANSIHGNHRVLPRRGEFLSIYDNSTALVTWLFNQMCAVHALVWAHVQVVQTCAALNENIDNVHGLWF